MKAITEEAMGISPGDVYARESSQAFLGRRCVVAVIPAGIGLQGSFGAVEERVVKRRAACSTAIGKDRFNHIGILGSPLIGLHGCHRPPEYERDPSHPELSEQAVL